jgi:predicted PurR-regulated permease PerM
MDNWQIETPRLQRILSILGVLGIIILGFHTFALLQKPFAALFDLLSPFILALILAYILSPLVDFIQARLRLGRMAGTLLFFFLTLLLFFTIVAVVLPVILSQLIELVEALRAAIPRLMAAVSESPYFDIDPNLVHTIETKLQSFQIDYEKIVGSILPAVKQAATGGISTVSQISMSLFQGIRSIIGFGAFLGFVAVLNFYLILDKDRIKPFFRKAIPPRYRERTINLLDKMDNALGGFLRGQLLVALLVGLMFTVGLFFTGFLGFPALSGFAILIGTAAGLCGFIPYFGPIIGVTPAILIVLLSTGPPWGVKLMGAMVVAALFIVIQAVEGMVLQPKILGKGAALHPLAILLALAVGARFGLAGMIAAVPAACIIRVLIIEFYWQPVQQMENVSDRELL